MDYKYFILCIDDDKLILDSLRQQLSKGLGNSFLIEFAEDTTEAFEIIEEYKDFDGPIVIISDWLMPGMKGHEFLIEVHKKHPKMIKIILTGHADEDAVQRAYEQANLFKCMRKPWDSENLIHTIKQGLSLEE